MPGQRTGLTKQRLDPAAIIGEIQGLVSTTTPTLCRKLLYIVDIAFRTSYVVSSETLMMLTTLLGLTSLILTAIITLDPTFTTSLSSGPNTLDWTGLAGLKLFKATRNLM